MNEWIQWPYILQRLLVRKASQGRSEKRGKGRSESWSRWSHRDVLFVSMLCQQTDISTPLLPAQIYVGLYVQAACVRFAAPRHWPPSIVGPRDDPELFRDHPSHTNNLVSFGRECLEITCVNQYLLARGMSHNLTKSFTIWAKSRQT